MSRVWRALIGVYHRLPRPHAARIGVWPRPMLDGYAVRIAAGEVQVWEVDGAIPGVLVLITEGAVMLLDNVAVTQEASGGR